MKVFVVLSALVAVAVASAPHLAYGAAHLGYAAAPLAYGAPVAHALPLAYTRYAHGAPVGIDGRVVDTPEVTVAKAEHAAAHINERVTLAHEAAKNAYVAAPAVVSAYAGYGYAAAPLVHGAHIAYAHGAPVGLDGRVVDTPEVAVAKAEHAAAHINEKVTLAHEAARSADYVVAAPAVVSAYAAHPAVSVW